MRSRDSQLRSMALAYRSAWQARDAQLSIASAAGDGGGMRLRNSQLRSIALAAGAGDGGIMPWDGGSNFWTNDHASLFVMAQDGWPDEQIEEDWIGRPLHASPNVGIERVEWDTEQQQVCRYCGAVMDGAVCAQCGSPAPPRSENYLGHATVTFCGTLPASAFLFRIPDGAIFELARKCAGDRSRYLPSEVIMRFGNCKTVKKWLPALLALTPDEAAPITLFVNVECDVELYPDGKE
jgi:hypothetical protein